MIGAGPLGKLKMGVQACTLLAVMALDVSGATLDALLYAMAAITVGSGVEVALRARRRAAPVAAAALARSGVEQAPLLVGHFGAGSGGHAANRPPRVCLAV